MSPTLKSDPLVMVTISPELADQLSQYAIAMVREHEGVTLVLDADVARENDLDTSSIFNLITLNVESDLLAVGLTARFASALASEEIPANVLAGYYHDHILVPEKMAEQAMTVLNKLSGCSK